MARFELRPMGNNFSLYDTGKGQQLIGGLTSDVAPSLRDVAEKLGDEAWIHEVWVANAYDDPCRAFGKTPEYWAQFKR